MAVFNRNGVNTNFIFIWSWLNLNALSLQRIFILPEYHFSQGSVTCTRLWFLLSPSLTHIVPAFPLCPLASPWPLVIQGNWSSRQTCGYCCGFVPAPASYYEAWLVAAAPTELAGWQSAPPLPPVVSLKSPILPPQKAGATSMSELPRCPDRPSVFAERFERCPNAVRG